MYKEKEYKMRYIRNTLLTLTVAAAVSTQSMAGGKLIAPVDAPVIPIVVPTTFNPLPIYIGIGAIAAFISRDACPCADEGSEIEDHRYGGVVRAGWDFNQYVGIEARALKTFGSDTFSTTEHYGLYLKPQYHVADQVNVYGLLGYGRTTVDYDNGIKSSHNPSNGFSYGAGFEYDLSQDTSEGNYARVFDGQGDQEKGWGLWLDFQHLLNNEGPMHTDNNIITGGITYDF
jgi:OOP family OmpA-OmpF porin